MFGKRFHIYADTSVFGGVFDKKFKDASRRFFELVRNGKFILATSPLVEDELVKAPLPVRQLYNEIKNMSVILKVTEEAIDLREAYLGEGIVSPNSLTDALHVALASVSGCGIIVSWNFKHIVNYAKIPLYNAVNILKGYDPIAIHSPWEVISDEKGDI
jgi:predicted nucleic acid-binding protein